MAIKQILIDTNGYAAFKQGRVEAVEIVRRATRLALNSAVLGELLAGFTVGSRTDRNRDELREFLASYRVDLFNIDEVTTEYYASIYKTLRGKGRPIPTNDMWVAASALQHGYALFSYDEHFGHIDGIVVGTTPAAFVLS
jgi:predicted nucleic acid-binding protein